MSIREKLIDEIIATKSATNDLLRSEGVKNLYLFNKYVLGVEEGAGKLPLAPFHKELCNFVQDAKDRKKLILIPRMHLKSTLVTIGYSLFNIVQNPDIRILILSGTYQNAIDFVRSIQDHLTRNQQLIDVFGNLAKDPIEWRNDRFTLSTNRTNLGEKEPTVMGAGVESNVVSKHFDLIILDDIVVRENTETIEQTEKIIKRYKDIIDLMEPSAQLLIIGTRWTDTDVYSWILDPESGQLGQFNIMIKKAMEWDGDLETALKTGEGFLGAIWPEKFSREELLKRYIAKGPYEFNTQYINEAVPDSEATFRKDWFRPYEETDIKGDIINNYLTIDPAISTEKSADYTAMVVTGIDRWGNIYVRDIVRERLKPSELINRVFLLYEKWRPKIVGLEDIAWQKTLSYSMREEMLARGRSLPIVPLKPQARSKDERIRGLQPLYANAKIYHSSTLINGRYLEDELRRFPRGQHDDIIDALSYVLDLVSKPRSRAQTYKEEYLY